LLRIRGGLACFGRSVADKELRNEMLVVAQLASGEEATRCALAGAGLLQLVVAVAVAPRLPAGLYPLPPHCLTTTPEDLELKRLAWAATAALCETPANREQVRRGAGLYRIGK
jgi:hypothetical protein